MGQLGTPFFAVVIVPLAAVERLDVTAWDSGPLRVPGQRSSILDIKERVASYSGVSPLDEVLNSERRWSCRPEIDTKQLVLEAVEVIALRRGWSGRNGHLILHIRSSETAAEVQAPTDLGQVARPGTRVFADLMRDVSGWDSEAVGDVRRASTLCLSQELSPGVRPLIRWEHQDRLIGRLTDLVVLRRYSADVGRPFELTVDRPTPSYVLVASGASMAVGRLREVKPEHVDKLRTLWLDAFLLELVQFEELTALAAHLRALSTTGSPRAWKEIADQFRRFRSRDLWAATTDHAIEAGIATRLRRELSTDELRMRIQAELDDHNSAAQMRAAEGLNEVLLVLTLAAVVLPLLLELRQGSIDGWVIAFLSLGGALVTYAAWRVAKGRMG